MSNYWRDDDQTNNDDTNRNNNQNNNQNSGWRQSSNSGSGYGARNNRGGSSYGNSTTGGGSRYGNPSSSYGNSSYGVSSSYGSSRYGGNSQPRGDKYDPQTSKLLENFEKDFLAKFTVNNKPDHESIRRFHQDHNMAVHNSKADPILEFKYLNFPPNISSYFREMNFETPTPIQAQGWPMALTGNDMVGIAQTGSGKSLSFIVPALIHLSENHKNNINSVALVLAPTRELCLQITEVAERFALRFGIKTVSIFGGVPKFSQIKKLGDGATFICACPGRLNDLIETGYVPIHNVSFLVLDEADRMLDMGFEPQLRQIVGKLPPKRQTLMWSATWPREVRDLANTYMTNYAMVTVGGDELCSAKSVQQKIFVIKGSDKFLETMKLFENDGDDFQKTIVFCNMKRSCDELESKIRYARLKGVYAAAIHGDKTQQARDSVINDFKSGRVNILIATDVAARGLDVRDVKRVLNYDMPQNCEQYVHRIGRTGRGTDKGISITYFTDADSGNAKDLIHLLRKNDQEIPKELESMAFNGRHAAPPQKRRRWG